MATRRILYLDDADLFEVISDFLNCGVFSKSLHKYGVVVRVVLLASCQTKKEETTRMIRYRNKGLSDPQTSSFHHAMLKTKSHLVHPLSRSLESLGNR